MKAKTTFISRKAPFRKKSITTIHFLCSNCEYSFSQKKEKKIVNILSDKDVNPKLFCPFYFFFAPNSIEMHTHVAAIKVPLVSKQDKAN